MSPELELLDQLGGDGAAPYLLMERHVFEGDRARALRGVAKMQAEGLVTLSTLGQPVEAWQLAAWRRAPLDSVTASALAQTQTQISITSLGTARMFGPL